MQARTVTVVGASGTLGTEIVRALIAKGARVRAMVRPTSNRAPLEALGVTDFAVADLMDPAALQRAMAAEPRAEAVVASAAGFTAHSRRTQGNDARSDTEGYRNLVDASQRAGIPRMVLISILECDKAPGVPHFQQKFAAEQYLAEKGLPYLALRAGAFLDRARDIVPAKVRTGVFPDILPGVAMGLIYTPDLARFAAQAALEVPASALNQHVDVCCDVPATGSMVAAAFSKALGRPVLAKPVFPRLLFTLMPLVAWAVPFLRDNVPVLAWLRKGGYISRAPHKQQELFGTLPTIEDSVARYCLDKGLMATGSPRS